MAKRRAEDNLLHDSPSKRRYRSLYSVDMQLHSVARSGGLSLSPPSLMALVGSRCRKRPHYFEDTDKEAQEAAAGFYYKTTHCDTRKHEANVLTVQTSGSFQESRISGTFTNHKKRQREDCVCANTATTKAKELADAGTNTEDCTYNSFQYWRVPLPELDLSLLEDAGDHSQAKDKDSSSEAMET
ncbi:WRNPLPNID domain-containing protein [Anabas testudineus]|uniref:WRNPLPNID domain-containing protein n=1 Tax=Anabas testudineus TaxID=64144 RepID=UPI00143D00B9|nr:WRNPLPNID domain-containing protein [Anabas testudineus]